MTVAGRPPSGGGERPPGTAERLLPRDQLLARLRATRRWDVIVIGGGASGLGCALDAAARGWSTLLLEARDFAAGTSSRSSKLIHGGLRYLAQGRVGLVHEALRERARLLANAPHRVRPLRFVVPTAGPWQRLKLTAGVFAYHALAGRHALGATEMLSGEDAWRAVPNLAPARAPAAVAYWDAQFDDARLAIDLMQSVFDHGGLAINAMPVVELLQENGRIATVHARDALSGETFALTAGVVINATGVWDDQTRRLSVARAPAMLSVSRGIHLVVDGDFLGGDDALVVPETDDGRLLFVLPWQGKVLLGTTDTPCPAPEDEPRPSDAEVDFVLSTAGRYLRRAPRRHDVRSAFAGLRPLLCETAPAPAGDAGVEKTSTAGLSREHQVREAPSGLIHLLGGKWTSYRAMAEDAVNAAAASAGFAPRACVTAGLAIHRGAPDDEPLAERIGRAVREEQAHFIDDVLARRTRLLFCDVEAALDAAPAVVEQLAALAGHPAAWRAAEIARFRALAEAYRLA